MVPASLLEAMAAIGLQALVLASLLTSTTGITILVGDVWSAHASAFAERQVEHLVDAAIARAGAGPADVPAVGDATSERIVFQADLDGDGVVDTSSAEQTELELRATSASSPRTLLHRLGRQGMTVEDDLPSTSRVSLLGRGGAPATPTDATGVEIPRRNGLLAVAIPVRLP